MTQPTCETPSQSATIPLDERAKQFWSAAYFIRHAPGRDRSPAIKILEHLSINAPGAIQERADKLLARIHNEQHAAASGEI
jgi:hypothetical protein